jgi:hypothetical protein
MLRQRLAAMVELGERCIYGLHIQQAQLRTLVGPDRPHPPRASRSVGTPAATTLLMAHFFSTRRTRGGLAYCYLAATKRQTHGRRTAVLGRF